MHGVLDRDMSMLRNRRDFWSLGAVGTVGIFLIEEYEGGGDIGGGGGACREGGGCVDCAGSGRVGNGGACRGSTTSWGVPLELDRRSDPDRRESSFMRLVERVRRNWVVKSAAHVGASGCWPGGGGTGFRRGTPLFWSAMIAVISSGSFRRGCCRRVSRRSVVERMSLCCSSWARVAKRCWLRRA